MRPSRWVAIAAVLLVFGWPGAAGAQTTLIDESFTGSDVQNQNFLVGGTSFTPCLTASQALNQTPIPGCAIGSPSLPTGGDPDGDGALRLTSNTNNLAGFILYQDRMPLTAGVDVSFDFYAYNGSGADGFSFFIADGAVNLTQPGASGGSLGYAQKTNIPGLLGGFVGVGVDEYGNFGNDLEGRGSGCSVSAGNQLLPDRASLRGPGTGTSQYCLIQRSGQLSFSLDAPGAKDRDDGARRRLRIVLDPPASPSPKITVFLADPPAPLSQVLQVPLPASPPATFKFGFAASTGGSTNIHEIRGLQVESIVALPRLALAKTESGPFVSGGEGSFTLTARTQEGERVGPVTTPVTVTDHVPAGELVGMPSGDGWNCSASTPVTVSCTRTASAAAPIPAGTTLPTISFKLRFDGQTSGRFKNVAEVDSQDNANTPAQSQGTVNYLVRPVGADDAATTPVGVPVQIPVLENDLGDFNLRTLEPSNPSNGVALWSSESKVVTYVPRPGFSGRDEFTYTVEDHSGQAITQTVRITVTPEAIDDQASTPFQTPVTIDILANDRGSFVPSTTTLVSGPSNGTVTFDNAGRARYVPNAGFTGQDTFVYRVLDGAGQPATATVIIDVGPPTEPEPTPPAAQLVVTKTADREVARVGEDVTYRVVVENRGDGTAENVRLVDSPVLAIDLVSLTVSQGSCQPGPPATCELGTIEPGDRVTITAVVRPTAPGLLVNGVAVTATTDDTRRRDNVDFERVTVVNRAASVRLSKRASQRRVAPGERIRFDIAVRSRGRRAARPVLTCDVMPRALAVLRAPAAARVRGRRICWLAGSLPVGESLRYQVLARARSTFTTRRRRNTAVVRGINFAPRRARTGFVVTSDPRLRACIARLPVARISC